MRAIKKIVALATGTLMVGATVLGAMAADLADYPKPMFIDDGKFNGAIVVGDKAAAEDVVGAIDIATSLQFSSTTATSVATAEKTVMEGDTWQVSSKTELLEISESLSAVQSSVGKDELVALADGVFSNEKGDADYEQEITLSDNISVIFGTDDDDVTSDFLYVERGASLGEYELNFKTDAESDIDVLTTGTDKLEDLEDETITLLGKDYTIVSAEYEDDVITLEMMGGAMLDTIEEGETKTYTISGKEYEVVALIVSDGDNSVKLKVNGEVTDKMYEDETERLADGTEIGIRSVMPNEAGEVTGGDILEFYLGAQKIELSDGNVTVSTTTGDMKVGEDTMDDATVDIVGGEISSGSEFRLTAITISYEADDDFYIAPGEKLSEQMEEPEALMNWDIAYEGLTTEPMSEIEVMPSGDDEYKLKLDVADGDVSIPLAFANSSTELLLGDDDDRLVINHSDIAKDEYFILTTGYEQGEKSYILQYLGADVPSGGGTSTLKFKNLASGETIERSFTTEATIRLGGSEWGIDGAAGANESLDDFNIEIDDIEEDTIITTGDATIVLDDSNLPDNMTLTIAPVDLGDMIDDVDNATDSIVVTITPGDEIDLDVEDGLHWKMESLEDEDNVEKALTPYGAEIRLVDQDEDPNKVTIQWPDSQREAQAFVVSGAVSVMQVAGVTTGAGVTVEKIEVGTAKLASEIMDVSAQNLVLVGGPCANDAAAEVMGVASTVPECLAGFEEGKAMVKLYNTGAGKVAMLVAGATAADTRRASRVVANYNDYALSGDEVEVTGTGMTNIQVTKMS